MMKRWICIVLTALLLTVSILPTCAAYKKVNNDRAEENPFFLNDCDSADGWSATEGVEIAYDRDEATEGFGSVRFTTDVTAYSNATVYLRCDFEDVSLENCDYITFDFYVSHPELVSATYQISVMVGSGSTNSNELCEWKAAMFLHEYTEGWNTITLPISQAQTYTADMAEIDNFRLYFKYINMAQDVTDLTLRIDNIEAHTYGSKAIQLNTCDTPDFWSKVDDVETLSHKEGESALVFYTMPISAGEGEHHLVRHFILPTPVDCSNADYLEFDMYVSDAAALRTSNSKYGLIFEITSSGTCDKEEYTWDAEYYYDSIKDGWNHIKLPIASAGISGSAPNMKAINYFRMHLLDLQTAANDLLTIKLDNIYLSVIQDGIDDYAEPEPVDPPENKPADDLDPEGQGGDGETPAADEEQSAADAEASAARKALTATRAKIVVVVFAFIIIGFNIVAVLLRNKEQAALVAEGEPENVTEILQAAEQSAQRQEDISAPAEEPKEQARVQSQESQKE
ncbi:MAG: hypothetical protein IJW40_00915 [Clostridia bacterium]|nr:hypothetical protein [Clostridia bacterium]